MRSTANESTKTAGGKPTSKDQKPYRLVSHEEFCRLLVSSRRLQRCDDPEHGLRGLLDIDTGERSMVSEVELMNRPARSLPRLLRQN